MVESLTVSLHNILEVFQNGHPVLSGVRRIHYNHVLAVLPPWLKPHRKFRFKAGIHVNLNEILPSLWKG